MRRCIKYCIRHVLAIGLLLVAFTGAATAAVDEVQTESWTTWPSTIYYLALLQGPGSPYYDAEVNITAADECTLYINGKDYGPYKHIDPDTGEIVVHTEPISIGGLDNIVIGVEVKNDGVGSGNGLMVEIKAEDSSGDDIADWLGTTTMNRRTHVVGGTRIKYGVAWYYYAGDIKDLQSDLGDEWYDQDEDFFVEITKHGFKQVMLGQMGDIKYQPDNHIEIITGYPGDIDIGSSEEGGIRLRRVEGENLALGKPSQEEKLTDGDLANGYAFNQDPVGITKYIDLEEIRRVNKMILFTGGTNPDTWTRDSVRGYSVEISLDQFRYEEVGVLHEIGISNVDEGDYDWYAIKYPDEWARYLRFKITEPRIFYPNIGEVMIYGVGYVYDGMYESEWFDFGEPESPKNFNEITWGGDMPEGTRIVVQTKTKYEIGGVPVESDWSIEHSDTSFVFDSPEPASAFKYRVKLFSQDIDFTPEFQELSVTYSDTDQPVASATGYVTVPDSPENKVPMGEISDIVYTIEYDLNSKQNIKSLTIFVPGESVVDSVYSSDVDGLVNFDYSSTTDKLNVTLESAVTGGDELKIYFKTKLLTNLHEFNAYLFNDTMNDGAGGVKIWERADKSWKVTTSTILESILSNVAAVPKVFTPKNGDTINNFTVFEFTLAKVVTDVEIKIYNTRGRLVYVKNCGVLTAKDHFFRSKAGKAKDAENLPGYWDGTDEDGDLVPPGVYIYQVVADTDSGDKIEGGTVVVAY